MTLDREAARALFANAEPMPSTDDSPFAPPTSLFGEPDTTAPAAAPRAAGAYRATNTRIDEPPFAASAPFTRDAPPPSARKGVDWRLVAPLGVAAVCAGAIALFALPRDTAEEGRTVAAADITAPPAATPLPVTPVEPADMAATAPVVSEPAPVVERVAATRPAAARRAPARQTAEREAPVAPSATDPASSSYASVTAPAVAAPTLGAPPPVALTPASPPPAIEPVPVTPPATEPQ